MYDIIKLRVKVHPYGELNIEFSVVIRLIRNNSETYTFYNENLGVNISYSDLIQLYISNETQGY
jgi:hypothetical protein